MPAGVCRDGKGKDAFFALGSGPARALARSEALFDEIDYRDSAATATLVLESSRPPPSAVVAKVAHECGLAPDRLTIIYAPTQSIAGGVQVVARVLEVALHKAHALKFPLDRLAEGLGAAPLSPPHPDLVTAMGRTNDAIIYAGPRPSLRHRPGERRARPRRRRCRARIRVTTASPLRRFSSGSRATSTPSIPCCSARRR